MPNVRVPTAGEAVSAQSILHLSPVGLPSGIDPSEWRSSINRRIEGHLGAVDALIASLDAMTSDPDLEPSEDGEPWLGWVGNGPRAEDNDDDREEANEHGGNVTDEPHDYSDEGNSDYCLADEMSQGNEMSSDQKAAAAAEARRLLAQARKAVL